MGNSKEPEQLDPDVSAGRDAPEVAASCAGHAVPPLAGPGGFSARPLAEMVPGGKRCVLLAEDERDLRELITGTLEDEGYVVVATASAKEAIASLQGGLPDLVITDLLMPGGGGHAVLAAVASLTEPPPVIVITGALNDDLHRPSHQTPVLARLQKPFPLAELLFAVHAALD